MICPMSGIFGSSGGSSPPSFDFSVLSRYYQAQVQSRVQQGSTNTAHAASTPRPADHAPWHAAAQNSHARLAEALTTTSFVDVRDSSFDKAGVSPDS